MGDLSPSDHRTTSAQTSPIDSGRTLAQPRYSRRSLLFASAAAAVGGAAAVAVGGGITRGRPADLHRRNDNR